MVVQRKRFMSVCAAAGIVAMLSWSAPASAQCPKRCAGGTNQGLPCSSSLQCDNGAFACSARTSCVHLEWRPTSGAAAQSQIAEVGLYAVSSNGFDQAVQSIEVILDWDPAHLELVGTQEPCDICNAVSTNAGTLCATDADCLGGSNAHCVGAPGCHACPTNTYPWLSTTFPNDCGLDGLNAPCSGGIPNNDGDAFYIAVSQVLCGEESAPPAFATPSGLLITKFRFRVLGTEGSESSVDVLDSLGSNTKTRVLGGNDPGTIVTGNISGPVRVRSQNCQPATVAIGGSRYLLITPPQDVSSVALLVAGDGSDSDVSCVDQYVQAPFTDSSGTSATLGPTPTFLTPAAWGTVEVRSTLIHPGKSYSVYADCGTVSTAALADGVEVSTWIWGDTDGNFDPNFTDIARVVEGFTNTFGLGSPPLTFPMADLVGGSSTFCEPNRDINFQDIAAAVDAFTGAPFSDTCAPPCP